MDILNIIEKINCGMLDSNLDDSVFFELEYISNGYYDAIRFLGDIIWCSEDDLRKYDDDANAYESLDIYLRREIRHRIELLNTIQV